MFSVLVVISALLTSIVALPAEEVPSRRSALPKRWYHEEDHKVHELFRRGPLPAVGSPEWRSAYPQYSALPETNIPPAWLAALHAAEAAGLIPNIAPSISNDGGLSANYPPGVNAGQEPICASMFQCRHAEDIWDAPDGMIGLSVDDGPVDIPQASPRLYDFLKANNQKVTHFMIGRNILGSPTIFMRAFEELQDDIAVHTWTHRHCSSLTNTQLVADLGWTMQIIHDSTGGRVPRYWRPPYGDADNRVRAIAKQVFGLTTVIWNQDSQDWTMGSGRTTLPSIQAAFTNWYNGPRSPGLIILEHEISPDDVTAFINMYPLIAAATGGAPWKAVSVAQLFDGHANGGNGGIGWYQNAANNTAEVVSADIIFGGSTTRATSTGAPGNATNTGSGTAVTPTTTVNTNGAERNVCVGVAGLAMAALLAAVL